MAYPNIYGDTAYLRELRNFFFRVLGMMDVTFYGAIGDGRTDNYANLQVAIDDAQRRGLHYIYVPFGTYCYRGQLVNKDGQPITDVDVVFVGNPLARIVNLTTGDTIYPQQFNFVTCNKYGTLTFVRDFTIPAVSLQAKSIDGSIILLEPNAENKMIITIPLGVPLSTMYEYIKIIHGTEEEDLPVTNVYTESTVIEIDVTDDGNGGTNWSIAPLPSETATEETNNGGEQDTDFTINEG